MSRDMEEKTRGTMLGDHCLFATVNINLSAFESKSRLLS